MKKNDYLLSIEVDLSLSDFFWLSCVVDSYFNFHVFLLNFFSTMIFPT